jgi:hypothetical protein
LALTVPGLEIGRFCEVGTLKAPQTESVRLRMLKFRQYLHKIHTDKQKKPQGAAALRDDAILIFKLVNFSFSLSEFLSFSEVWYLRKPLRQKV